MARPTVTRLTLRQAICRELQERFFRKFPTGSIASGNGSTTTLVDTRLTGSDSDYWVGDWFYAVSGTANNIGQMREISDFTPGTHTLTLESALPSATTSSDGYEIHSIWTPEEVHQAINRAIDAGGKAFFDQVTDESLIICEDKMTYDLSTLTVVPWTVSRVSIERNLNPLTGTATAGAAGSITLASTDRFDEVSSDCMVSISDGTGKGQVRAVSGTVAPMQVTVASNWTTAPDTTSKYVVWNPVKEEGLSWYQIMAVRFNAKEFPDKMYLSQSYNPLKGMRIRLEYAGRPPALNTDSGTTFVPAEYVINKACAYLYGTRIGDNRSDRQKNTAMEAYYSQKAEMYLRENAYRMTDRTLWQEQDITGLSASAENPMGW